MKLNLASILRGAALAVAVTSGPIAAETTDPAEGLTPSPMVPHRNADGSIKRGLRNEIQTGYWSGFAVTASAPYTSASATFQVPSVRHDGLVNVTEYVSQWVGIGGYGDATLIQLGAMEWVGPSGGESYVVGMNFTLRELSRKFRHAARSRIGYEAPLARVINRNRGVKKSDAAEFRIEETPALAGYLRAGAVGILSPAAGAAT
jgi:hypothetical protein